MQHVPRLTGFHLLETSDLQPPPPTPVAAPGRNHIGNSQFLVLPTALSRRV